MGLTRRRTIKLLGAGSLGLMTGGFTLPSKGNRHLITLSFDDGFEKSSIRTAEIYEKYGLSACINVIASAHMKQFELPSEYHKWPVGDFDLWNDLKRRGHEIMPHGYKHANLGEMPLEEAKELVYKCIEVFNNELVDFRAEEWLGTRFRILRTHGGAVNPLPHKGMWRLGCTSFGPENIDEHLATSIDEFLEGSPGHSGP